MEASRSDNDRESNDAHPVDDAPRSAQVASPADDTLRSSQVASAAGVAGPVRYKWWDWLVIGVLLGASLLWYFWPRPLPPERWAVLRRRGEIILRLPLINSDSSPEDVRAVRISAINAPDSADPVAFVPDSADSAIIVPVPGEEHVALRFDGKGRVAFAYSDCPDQICVHMGAVERPGQLAVCLPKELVLTVEGEPRPGERLPDVEIGHR
ncbi:MAG: NusG domain II-containing protein [Clostridiaceae bacterium]|nr:NusG domain II-containing protein [Clostridiaceae bacterium]